MAGCVGRVRSEHYYAKRAAYDEALQRLEGLSITPSKARACGLQVRSDGVVRQAKELLGYPGINIARIAAIWPEVAEIEGEIAEQVEIEAQYACYLERQESEINSYRRDRSRKIPCEIDSVCIHGDNESSLATAKSIKKNLIENGLKLKSLNSMNKFKI